MSRFDGRSLNPEDFDRLTARVDRGRAAFELGVAPSKGNVGARIEAGSCASDMECDRATSLHDLYYNGSRTE